MTGRLNRASTKLIISIENMLVKGRINLFSRFFSICRVLLYWTDKFRETKLDIKGIKNYQRLNSRSCVVNQNAHIALLLKLG